MSASNKNAPSRRGAAKGAGNEHRKALTTKVATKRARVLQALIDGRRLHRFMAERALCDHVLPSTISEIQSRYGIRVERRRITVPGYRGLPAHVAEYWLSPDERRRARAILRSCPEGA